jgi:hypothetical protein
MTGRPRQVIIAGYSISYAHEDEALKNALTQQLRGLQRQGLIAPIIVASVFVCLVRPHPLIHCSLMHRSLNLWWRAALPCAPV